MVRHTTECGYSGTLEAVGLRGQRVQGGMVLKMIWKVLVSLERTHGSGINVEEN